MQKRKYHFVITHLYLLIFVLGYAAMPYMVQTQFERRGYLAFGGEWLLPLLVIGVLEILRELAIMLIYAYEDCKKVEGDKEK
mgnify:CR=1 FL=1